MIFCQVIFPLVQDPVNSGIGILMILSGVPVYWVAISWRVSYVVVRRILVELKLVDYKQIGSSAVKSRK